METVKALFAFRACAVASPLLRSSVVRVFNQGRGHKDESVPKHGHKILGHPEGGHPSTALVGSTKREDCASFLQETLVDAIYQRLAAMRGVKALRISSAKPDIYGDTRKVGVEVASFTGCAP